MCLVSKWIFRNDGLPSTQFAERFAQEGFCAFIFDYRFFGESKGEPRHLIVTNKQREDIRNAIRFLKQHKEIDPERIVLWGTSLGGGHVIAVAASDPTLAAVIGLVPGIDMVSKEARATIKIPAGMLLRILLSALLDGFKGLLGLKPYYIKVFGFDGETAVFTSKELKPRFETLVRSSKTWENKFTPRFYLSPPRYIKGTAEKIEMPLLICIADREVYGNPSFQEWVGRQAPKGEVKRYAAEHFDVYVGKTFDLVLQDQIEFIHKHVS